MVTGRGTLVDVAVGFGRRGADSIAAPVELEPGLSIEALELRDQAGLLDACAITRLEHHPIPPHGYVLVALGAEQGRWDKSGRLWRAINYSRLAWPNVMAREFVAQVQVDEDGSLARIEAPDVPAPFARAYLAPGLRPAFPSAAAVDLLRRILRSAGPSARSSRVGRAMWRYSHGALIYFANFRAATLIGAIETLVNTEQRRTREQFISRVAGMSQLCLGHRRNGRRWARRIYKVRNSLAHGRRLLHHRRGYSADAFERAYEILIAEIDEFVRSVLLAAYTRRDILQLLQSPTRVAARWPVK